MGILLSLLAVLFLLTLSAQIRLAWVIRARAPQLWLSIGKPNPFAVFGQAGRTVSRFAWMKRDDDQFRVECWVYVTSEVCYFIVLVVLIIAIFMME